MPNPKPTLEDKLCEELRQFYLMFESFSKNLDGEDFNTMRDKAYIYAVNNIKRLFSE